MKKLIIFLLLVTVIFAQNKSSIFGTITDKVTKKRLPYVTVLIEGTNLGATSNEKGDYIIKNINPGTYKTN